MIKKKQILEGMEILSEQITLFFKFVNITSKIIEAHETRIEKLEKIMQKMETDFVNNKEEKNVIK